MNFYNSHSFPSSSLLTELDFYMLAIIHELYTETQDKSCWEQNEEELRSYCSQLYPVCSRKSSRMETTQHCRLPAPLPWRGKIIFCISMIWTMLQIPFSLAHPFFHSLYALEFLGWCLSRIFLFGVFFILGFFLVVMLGGFFWVFVLLGFFFVVGF